MNLNGLCPCSERILNFGSESNVVIKNWMKFFFKLLNYLSASSSSFLEGQFLDLPVSLGFSIFCTFWALELNPRLWRPQSYPAICHLKS